MSYLLKTKSPTIMPELNKIKNAEAKEVYEDINKIIQETIRDISDDMTNLISKTDVDARNYTSINAAVTAIGTTLTTLIISNSQILADNLIIPSTLRLKIVKGGLIIKASAYTLTINGPCEIGLYKVFSGFSAGNVTFGINSVPEAYPQWWGAVGDGATDDTTALLCVAATGVKIYIPEGTYLTTSQISFNGLVSGHGENNEYSMIKANGSMESPVKFSFGTLKNLQLNANSLATYGLVMHDAVGSKINKVKITGAVKDGIYGDTTGNNNGLKIDTCLVASNGTAYTTGDVTTVASDQTIVFSGVDLTTLGLREGVDYIKINGETVPNMIITITDATHAEVYPAPVGNLNNVTFSIKSGNGIHIGKQGNNSSWIIENTIIQNSIGAAIMDLSLYGATGIKNICEVNYFGRVIGRRGVSEVTYSATDIAGYYESSTYADIYLEYADGCAVINPLTPVNIKILLAPDFNFIGNGPLLTGTMGLGTVTPDANSILDLVSTTKAFLPPRMTTVQRNAIGSPVEGMIIYNLTTHVLDFYNGTSWGAV